MKNTVLSIAAALALLLPAACGKKAPKIIESGTAASGDPGYKFKLTVDKLQFDWKVNGQYLDVKLKAPVQAWLAAGFNPADGMQGANMIIGTFDSGKPVVTDQYGIDPKHHKEDTELGGKDDVMKAAGQQTAAGTEVSFSIPLNSGDRTDNVIDPASVTLMLAYGKTDETAQKHPFWAEAHLNLNTGAYELNLKKEE